MTTGIELRALVVEDDPSWQQILTEILSDFGLAVDIAENYEEAVQYIRHYPHRIAVLDLSLGGPDHNNQDGLKVLEDIRRYDPNCASIFLSGFATVELAVNVIQKKGAFTCLRKESFRRSDFRTVVNQAMMAAPLSTGLSGDLSVVELQPKGAPSSAGSESASRTSSYELALVVEDDAGWRSLLSELLVDAGFQIHQSISYIEALGMLRSSQYRLAVIDLSLASSIEPEINRDGYHLLANTQKLGIPTIIVSGYANPAEIERAYNEYQLFSCLEKQSFDRKNFIDTVLRASRMRVASSELQNLTVREREVLALLAQGMTNKEIASSLWITTNTVKRHLKSLFAKLGVNTRSAASSIASRTGIVSQGSSGGSEYRKTK